MESVLSFLHDKHVTCGATSPDSNVLLWVNLYEKNKTKPMHLDSQLERKSFKALGFLGLKTNTSLDSDEFHSHFFFNPSFCLLSY